MRQTGVDEDIALDATQGLAHCGQERARATVADEDCGPPVHDLDDRRDLTGQVGRPVGHRPGHQGATPRGRVR